MGFFAWIKRIFWRSGEPTGRAELECFVAETDALAAAKRREREGLRAEAERLRTEVAFLDRRIAEGDFGSRSEESVRDSLREREREMRQRQSSVEEINRALDTLDRERNLAKRELDTAEAAKTPHLDADTIRRIAIARKRRQAEDEERRIKLAAAEKSRQRAQRPEAAKRAEAQATEAERPAKETPAPEKRPAADEARDGEAALEE